MNNFNKIDLVTLKLHKTSTFIAFIKKVIFNKLTT